MASCVFNGDLNRSPAGKRPRSLQRKEFAYQYNGIFARFMTMREKQILARAIRIQKETGGYRAFIEIIELKFGKKIPWIFCTLKLF